MKHRNLARMVALGLSAALLLGGCELGFSSISPSPSASESAPQEDGRKDYSKYNSYLHLSDEMSEALDVLDVYFANVEYQADFAVMEGGDYAAIKDAVQFYTAITFRAEEALNYVDKDPSYARVDAAVRALGNSPVELMEAVDDLAAYMRFDEFEEDNLAKAPEIHTAIWEPFQIFATYYGEFLSALDELEAEIRGEDLESMLNEGEMILYYSNVIIYTSQDIRSNIWNQYEAGVNAADPDAEFILPEIDMTELSPLFGEFNQAYESLIEAMGDEEEAAKVFTGPVAESAMKLYTSKVDSLYSWMGRLANTLMEGGDYTDDYNSMSEALSSMISGYNSII